MKQTLVGAVCDYYRDMKFVIPLSLVGLVVGAKTAAANECDLSGRSQLNQVHLGCPIEAITQPWNQQPFRATRADRTGTPVDVTDRVIEDQINYPVTYNHLSPTCEWYDVIEPTAFRHVKVTLKDVLVGDLVTLLGGNQYIIAPAGPCGTPDFGQLQCTDPLPYENCPGGGSNDPVPPPPLDSQMACSTTTATGAAPVLFVALLVGGMRRRSRHL